MAEVPGGAAVHRARPVAHLEADDVVRVIDAADTMDMVALLIAAYCERTGMAPHTLQSYLQVGQQELRCAGPQEEDRAHVAGLVGESLSYEAMLAPVNRMRHHRGQRQVEQAQRPEDDPQKLSRHACTGWRRGCATTLTCWTATCRRSWPQGGRRARSAGAGDGVTAKSLRRWTARLHNAGLRGCHGLSPGARGVSDSGSDFPGRRGCEPVGGFAVDYCWIPLSLGIWPGGGVVDGARGRVLGDGFTSTADA